MQSIWNRNDEWHSSRAFPERLFGPAIFFTQMKTVIGKQDNNGVFCVRALIESIQQTPDLCIGKTDGGKIRLNCRFPLILANKPIMRRWHFMFSQFDCRRRQIITIVGFYLRCMNVTQRVRVKKTLRGIEWDMGSIESRGHEKRLAMFLFDLLNGPSCSHCITKLVFLVQLRAKVPQLTGGSNVGNQLLID